MTQPVVYIERDGPVAEVVLNRPEKLNSLSWEMIDRLEQALKELRDARAVLIRGEGRAFCAGWDLSQLDNSRDIGQVMRARVHPVLLGWYSFPAPTIAAVHGACLGMGLGLAFACDVVIAAEDAVFASPFRRLGAVLDSGGHYHFVRLLGRHRALELIYTGRRLSAREAEAWGLVNRAVGNEELLPVAREMARHIADGPTVAFRLSKEIVLASDRLDLAGILEAEAIAQVEAARTQDFREGMRSFREKREPTFSGS